MAKVLTAAQLVAIKDTAVKNLKITDLQNLLETIKRVPLQKADASSGECVGNEETSSAVVLSAILTDLA